MDDPLVSVVIPCHGQAHFLGEAIESALAQNHPGVEVVVVDDGSPDDTAEVAGRYEPVRLLRLGTNCGLARARNIGLAAATGDYVVFLDADDVLVPGALEAGLAAFAVNPGVAFVAGDHVLVDEHRAPLPRAPRRGMTGRTAFETFLLGNRIGMGAAALFRRESVTAVGGFDPAFGPCADYDLYLRLSRHGEMALHDAGVAEYRRHGANMSNDPATMLAEALHALRRQREATRSDPVLRRAYLQGRRNWTEYYLGEAARGHRAFAALLVIARAAPIETARWAVRRGLARLRRWGG